MESKLSKLYKYQFNELRKIIHSWKLLGNEVPLDEFDSVVHLIISQLSINADKYKMIKVIAFELNNNYGFSVKKLEVEKWVNEILEWYQSTDCN